MDKAKAAVSDFMSKAGQHDTTVHEKVAPAVQNETVTRTHHDNVTTAVDKEVHQDHYHTSVQPIKDTQTLPEQHHHNLVGVEHRNFEHGNKADVDRKLNETAAQFRDSTQRVEGQHTTSQAPAIGGEHMHHHVHETIQPVINKQTIEPHVTHTTVPIHEVHHNSAQHHATSALPAVSMSDFKKEGGVLSGREERYDGFEGEPRSIGGHSSSTHTGTHGTGSGLTGEHSHGSNTHGHAGGAAPAGGIGAGVGSGAGLTGSNTHNSTQSNKDGKPSLMDKLNPKKDADGDGKAGFMK
ncbi:hypothetical protein CLAFUW4_11943 [Fulvia fulva]|uniref:Allergen n=1 Tax=Passalora fulva TaxID=5499 RepID=A0A9Q8PES7_PASFU|nr:uncharacterized protein CLAFUR5_10986 [Fulvia fulva]KAK4617635.1 hypothetical protein CLAFUR4_11948 [Fulvia fulva]KAK4618550.1 hypothetical protein CLAFUR0_11959 [Fulvia fulva]UJO21110.1 hypothetical protein CLAFUR5_10986 [Fulvia fulva]WPV18594.1 hypothetical protein CLAFUW4_11943 [Fulvia fulva]WPV33459.1 hypothetical protein CLAFUW7_11950 [Fulvia fulva]